MKKQVNKIKEKLVTHKTLVKNFSYLSILQVFNIVLPLIAYPYLINVLGNDIYGIVVFAQAIVGFFVILVGFGFNITATKEISIHRNNKEKINEIVSSVFIIKGTLFIIAFILFLILINFLPQAQGYENLFYFTMWMCLYELMFPIWYFQGIEQMKYITFLNLISRIIFLVFIFIIVKSADDFIYVPITQGLGAITASITALYILFLKNNIKLKRQKISTLKNYLTDGSNLFYFRLFGVIKTEGNKVFLGLVGQIDAIVFYDLASKIANVFITLFQNYTKTVLPKMAKEKNKSFAKKSLILVSISGLIIYIISSIALYPLTIMWDIEMLDMVKLYWIIGLLIPVYAIADFVGNSVLVTNGYSFQHLFSTAWTTVLFILLLFVFYLFSMVNIYTLAIVLLLCQLLSTLHKLFYCRKYKLLN